MLERGYYEPREAMRCHEEAAKKGLKVVGKAASWADIMRQDHKLAGPQSGKSRKLKWPRRCSEGWPTSGKAARWAEDGVAMPWPSRENDHAWKDPQHARQNLQHAWVKHAWKDPQRVWKGLQHTLIDLQIAIHSDRDRRPPNENITALADDLVSSK
ncbi:hypothetical protein VE02_03959 [Pseudogymnoascus sp. 03VT05]|nr:hypothetical protein VE02_03959 [Pseudogymnoascus sp. 03VT05]